MKFIAVCLCLAILGGSVVAVALSMYVVKETANDEELLNLDDLKLNYTSIVYYPSTNADGQEEWIEYKRLDSPIQNRIWVSWGDISENLTNAFVAIEDNTFWEHNGINFRRTVYAMLNEVSRALTGSYLRGNQQGASTITQQLIKNITDDDEDQGTAGYLRKIREIFRALALTNRYSRDTIFEAYLNTISLTGNIGGVEAGANRYFNKSVGDETNISEGKAPLTYAQCATIAGVTNNPTRFSPITNPEDHLVRRDRVLQNMYNYGYITEQELEEALAEPLTLYETVVAENAAVQSNNNYFVDTLINDLISDYMEQYNVERSVATNEVYNSGWRIYATVVPSLQETMEDVFNRAEYWAEYPIEEWVPRDSYRNVILNADGTEPEPKTIKTNAAGAIINYRGELCAVAGGLGAKTADRTLNRAVDSTRAVGSTMKMVATYPLALEYDRAWYSSTQIDMPYEGGTVIGDNGQPMDGWPRNYSGTYTRQPMTVEHAVAESINTVAVWYGSLVGVNDMFTFAQDTLEISSLTNDDRNLAPIVLGALSHGVSPYELAGAYMMYGNGGEFYSLHSYTSVEDSHGNVIMRPDVNNVQAISADTAYIGNRLLREVITKSYGTAVGMGVDEAGMDSIAKTGTTNDNKDIWLVGLTPYYVSSFWYGYDENEAMKRYVAGSRRHPGLNAWREIMNKEQADVTRYSVIDFPQEAFDNGDVVERMYCTVTGKIATAGCPQSRGYYKKDLNVGTCLAHGG